jgi:hypothetical protein
MDGIRAHGFPIVIGITTERHPPRSNTRKLIQDFLADHNCSVYLPHLVHLNSANLALFYRAGVGIVWNSYVWTELRRFAAPVIAHIGKYWYAERGKYAWIWTKGDGRRTTLAESTVDELATFWYEARLSWERHGISGAWVLLDEPPASPRFGLNDEILQLVQKLDASCREAGVILGVATPGPSQLQFWRKRIRPRRWILGGKHPVRAWRNVIDSPSDTEIWLYNRTNERYQGSFKGLAEAMLSLGAIGYLHWSFDVPIGTRPLGNIVSGRVTWNDDGLQLLQERERYLNLISQKIGHG